MSFFLFNQKTAYDMRISDWSSDVCSSDLFSAAHPSAFPQRRWVGVSLCRGWIGNSMKSASLPVFSQANSSDSTALDGRCSEERRVGKEYFRTCRYSGLSYYKVKIHRSSDHL